MSTQNRLRSASPWLLASCLAVALAPQAHAQAPAAAAPAAPPAPTSWASSIAFSAQVEGGITGNFDTPKINFGHLFTDRPNTPVMNQLLLTVQRPTDPKATGWDFGFQLQGLFGTDARYTHFLGVLDRVNPDGRYQPDITEANVLIHMPVLTEGGVDMKVGMYPTPIGFETIDPSTNPFYTHSYIFNFGIPLKHTGALAILHASPMVDIYGGVDSGVNTTLGGGDNNNSPGGIVGFGLTLLDGQLTVLALSHIGSETPSIVVPHADSYLRYLNDAVITYKATDKLTLTTELNWIHDDLANADGWGVAQYASYVLTDQLTLNGRAEAWGDGKSFYVAAFPGNNDFVSAERGIVNPSVVFDVPGGTTFGAITLGVTYKPTLPAPVANFAIRPEIRYDHSLNGTKPFNGGKNSGAFTIAADFILGF